MKNDLSNAFTILRQDGLGELFSESKSALSRRTTEYYFHTKGKREFTIGDTAATFGYGHGEGGARTRERFYDELPVLEDMISELNPEDVFYDIGANTGLYTCFAGHAGKNVVAFEPYPPNTKQLESNIQHNSLDNVQIIDSALSNENGEVSLKVPEQDEVGYGSASIKIGSGTREISIDTVRGDELVERDAIPVPNVVKIDVEGAEAEVIEGLEESLRDDDCRVIYCEIHLPNETDTRPSTSDYGNSPSAVVAQLEDIGFEMNEMDRVRGGAHYKGTK